MAQINKHHNRLHALRHPTSNSVLQITLANAKLFQRNKNPTPYPANCDFNNAFSIPNNSLSSLHTNTGTTGKHNHARGSERAHKTSKHHTRKRNNYRTRVIRKLHNSTSKKKKRNRHLFLPATKSKRTLPRHIEIV